MARTAIQAVAMVSSLVDTQESIVMEPRAEVRSPSRRNLYWAIPLAVVGFLAVRRRGRSPRVLPSTLVATKHDCKARDADGVCTEDGPAEKVQFAIVPADAQPVEPRLSIDGPTMYDSDGQVLFVTVRTPELSMLEWWVGRNNPAVSPKSYSDLFATETPQQQTTRGQTDMRTAKETAEYVALSRLGFDAKLTPGEVIIDELVCLKASDDGRTCEQFAPSDRVARSGRQVGEGRRHAAGDGRRPGAGPGQAQAGRQGADRLRARWQGGQWRGRVDRLAGRARPHDHRLHPERHRHASRFPTTSRSTSTPSRSVARRPGLAFTLTLIDQLSEGDLIGGKRVAVTGTIDINAKVGAIGGLTSKASAVLQIGRQVLPRADCPGRQKTSPTPARSSATTSRSSRWRRSTRRSPRWSGSVAMPLPPRHATDVRRPTAPTP